jgi:peptide/nickel transport system substrate-binding protein
MKFNGNIFFGSITCLFLLVSCGTEHADNKNVFCYNESNGITSLDPAFARDLEIMWATNQLFDGLVELNDSLQITPSVSESFSISDDLLTYTFFLRRDVYFHNNSCFPNEQGRKVVASDVVYSFNRILDNQVASPGKWIFEKVSDSGFSAPNDSIFIIQLKEPFSPFLGLLTTQYANIVPHESVEMYGSDFRNHPVGCGPFQFAFWYENVALVFHKNPNYYLKDESGNSLPYLDAVKIDFVKDMSAEYQGLLQGKYDFMSGIHNAFKDELLDPNGNLSTAYTSQLYLQKTPFIKTDYLGFVVDPSLQSNKALLDPRVRMALHLSLNKKDMVKHLRNNTVIPADFGFCSPAAAKNLNTEQLISFNKKQALDLLAEAGFPNGKNLPTIVLSTTSDYADLMEYIQHEWQQLGIPCEIQQLQGAAFRDQASKCQLSVFRKSWLADYAHPENFYSIFTNSRFAPNGPNYTHFHNNEYEKTYSKLGRTNSTDSTLVYSKKLEAMLNEETPVIPLYYDQVMHFVRSNIKNFPTNSVNMLDLRRVKKE